MEKIKHLREFDLPLQFSQIPEHLLKMDEICKEGVKLNLLLIKYKLIGQVFDLKKAYIYVEILELNQPMRLKLGELEQFQINMHIRSSFNKNFLYLEEI